ncbi:MAG: deoxyribose-phosphate aldolase [Kiritimatiellales bacterium]|nr:deoxyribose-phosphate aldolase [Kiritimatiellota bacterium]MBL7012470.1 deoxyribose-phosphate aldolase [Kiritimatiellales bacterium]
MNQPISRYLDAAILVPSTTREEAVKAIQTCVELNAYSACVRPCDIELAQELCRGTETKVCVVLAFPHGLQLSASKADEAKRYVEMGVDEIDMVANYGWVKSGLWDDVKADIAAVSAVTKPAGTPLKVIFETSQLNATEIKKMVEICIEAGADFVKTSTGFNGEGAREEDVKLMLETAAGRIKVKPSGGIRDLARAQMFIDMGAHRLGVNWSSSAAICTGQGAASEGAY